MDKAGLIDDFHHSIHPQGKYQLNIMLDVLVIFVFPSHLSIRTTTQIERALRATF
jgi:hypothetical protein